ncbi:MAG: hypothetical protein ACOCZX_00110 [Candidatus Bipolaricaulota bacterium]
MTAKVSCWHFSVYVLVGLLILVSPQQSSGAGEPPAEGCRILVSSDRHVAPAAELASTKGYPDIIALENSLIKITSVPNRGRLLFDFHYKPAERSLTYTEVSPMPVGLEGKFFLEYGGLYPSYPWNPRANQPYNLDYETQDRSPAKCVLEVFKKEDEDLPLNFLTRLRIKEGDPAVYFTVELSNPITKSHSIDWKQHLVLASGTEMSSETRLVLPRGADQTIVLESESEWLGKSGDRLSLPGKWQKWGNFQERANLRVPLEDVPGDRVMLEDPTAGLNFVQEWEAETGYDHLEILSWGPGYRNVFGAFPGFRISAVAPDLTVQPGEAQTFELKLYPEETTVREEVSEEKEEESVQCPCSSG